MTQENEAANGVRENRYTEEQLEAIYYSLAVLNILMITAMVISFILFSIVMYYVLRFFIRKLNWKSSMNRYGHHR